MDRSWVGLGPKVNEFESKWMDHLDCNAYALNSATALHLALSVFKLKKVKSISS